MGKSILNWSGVTDNKLSPDSYHPLTNQAATKEFLRQQALLDTKEAELKSLINQANTAIDNVKSLKASTYSYGMAIISGSTNVTDVNAGVLSTQEKNSAVNGTIMNMVSESIKQLRSESDAKVNILRQERENSIATLRAETNNKITAALNMSDSTMYNGGSILNWVVQSPSLASYVEVTPTVFPDRPPISGEVVYLKFGFIPRIVVLAINYIENANNKLWCRHYFSGVWRTDWMSI